MPQVHRLADIVAGIAAQDPQRTAVVADGEVLSYAALRARIDGLARALAGLGFRPGQTVAIGTADPLAHLLLLAAFEQCDVITGSFRADEGDSCHELLAAVDVVVIDSGEPGAPCRRWLALSPDWIARAAAGPPPFAPPPPAEADAPMMILRSSGTTGRPKRMVLTRAMMAARCDQRVAAYGMTASPRYLLTMNPNVFNIVVCVTLSFRLGGLVVIERRLPLWLAFAAVQPTHATMLPRQLRALLAALPPDFDRLPGLTLILLGARVSPALRAETLARLAGRITDHYGTNEAGLTVPLDARSEGAPVPGAAVAILDRHGAPVAEGQSGRVAVRGPSVVTGYLDAPEATARHFRAGWFLTDDLAVALPGGRLRLIGRSDDVLNLGGHKLACADVEGELRRGAGLADVAVLGGEDDAPAIVACVLAGAETLAQAEGRIRACLPGLLAEARVCTVGAIPRTPNGKLRRPALRAMLGA